MAATSSALPPLSDPEFEKRVEELSDVKTQEEYEQKVTKFGFSLTNWMKYIFNTHQEEFHAEWLTVS